MLISEGYWFFFIFHNNDLFYLLYKINRQKKEFKIKIRIYYEDTDIGGIVYHSNYLKYCERARSEFFFKQKINPFNKTSHFVAKKLDADYISTCTIGDIIEVKTRVILIKNVSVKLNQSIYKNEIKIFNMNITLAFIKNGRLSKIEDKFLDIFSEVN